MASCPFHTQNRQRRIFDQEQWNPKSICWGERLPATPSGPIDHFVDPDSAVGQRTDATVGDFLCGGSGRHRRLLFISTS